MKIEKCTIKNNEYAYEKPNEDFMITDIDKGIYIVSDGVSRSPKMGKYPNPSPSAEIAKIFSEKLYQLMTLKAEEISESMSQKDLYVSIFPELRKFNQLKFPVMNYNEEDYAGLVCISVFVYNNCIYFSYVGDCIGVFLGKNRINVFTEFQTDVVDIFKRNNKSLKNLTEVIRRDLRNNIESEYGYGVLNGDFEVMNFLKEGVFQYEEGDRLVLCSDGIRPVIDHNLDMLKNGKCDEIIKKSIELENLYSIRSDDKTIIIVDF
ncbi:hypothetical protein [Armatimonas rosea]|uniref:Serine/threonine protein phosphatase PrpC n=1 Tax=Armatimonas rosea TaxID=685828 RepID=A0A7W9WA45_ARMRO|nr:hypothetical protein [Armatimonas rosea]MBB6053910.1 serine/threonine protein phosphatase PrpC [Armatimonas rosea]